MRQSGTNRCPVWRGSTYGALRARQSRNPPQWQRTCSRGGTPCARECWGPMKSLHMQYCSDTTVMRRTLTGSASLNLWVFEAERAKEAAERQRLAAEDMLAAAIRRTGICWNCRSSLCFCCGCVGRYNFAQALHSQRCLECHFERGGQDGHENECFCRMVLQKQRSSVCSAAAVHGSSFLPFVGAPWTTSTLVNIIAADVNMMREEMLEIFFVHMPQK